MNDITTLAILVQILAVLERLEQAVVSRDQVEHEHDKILKTAEAAQFLRIGQAELLGLVHSRQVPCTRWGKAFLFSKRQLIETFRTTAQNHLNNAAD
ncbi:hypothetical protein [Deinococcus budaensis]|uniref:Helix-turn-helix domain-containing protein n=1 Tax=Deinococcus budaensis TaxID=1665626 RepID=A0A7W8GCX9_9DEIO|nr:hypothetical protein [Deinococcus budaensis]MBB5233188.1 hypothetical protein [Deinococcus budaensis]